MGSVLLVIYLMVIILLVVLILMQRNSGNALSGLGGGNGSDSFLSARGKGNLLTRTTAILATLMFVLALALDLYYKGDIKKVDSITTQAPLAQTQATVPTVPDANAETTASSEQPNSAEATAETTAQPVSEEKTEQEAEAASEADSTPATEEPAPETPEAE